VTDTPAPETPPDELVRQRRAKVQRLRDGGVNPYPNRFAASHTAAAALDLARATKDAPATADASVAGRLMTRRDMGKAAFAHLQDRTAKIQIFMKKDDLGDEAYARFKELVDLGDILGVSGTPFLTKTGEPSIHVKSWTFLSKALRPPPEKFHGMTDVEVRYRRREVDLFSNEEARRKFVARNRIVSALRRALDGDGFIEVETPMMQPIPGGAAARPFITHHQALDMDLYMRIAPELYLKRLLVGGLERVYEVGRAFRNEGIDTRHNPEFTILEAYQAYTDIEGMRRLTETLIEEAAVRIAFPDAAESEVAGRKAALADHRFSYRGKEFSLKPPYPWLSFEDLFREHLKLDYRALCLENGWRKAARELGVGVGDKTPDHKCLDAIFDEKLLPHLPPVAFVHGHPSAFSPLAKQRPDAPEVAERFELFVAGDELANAYSEQNDPDVQRKHFLEQARQRQAGDEEAMPVDEEFLTALEHAMPPAGGLGIGVDRLTMVLTGTDSIREVILFPLLRPEKS
jgi:lysyl-tRNA synthetase class 2